MAVRSDIVVDWHKSPRIITVLAPSNSVSMQDLLDTLRDIEDSDYGMAFESLVKASGKEALGGGVYVGITLELQNAKLSFEPRSSSAAIGAVTTADPQGRVLIDSSATFVSAGIEAGDTVVNLDDGSIATVLSVESETQLTTWSLVDGVTNEYGIGDEYKVWCEVQCTAFGGNIVAVDDVGDPMPPVHQTAGTHVVVAASSSATIAEITTEQLDAVAGSVWDELTSQHTDFGTFGGEVATKADVKAAAATVPVIAGSAALIQGTNVSGSSSDAEVRDGTYWVLGEDPTNGLIVEFTFNLASSEHKPGEIDLFGHYSGNPATEHYIELWAYNYQSSSWEQLEEGFLPGGNTSSMEFCHEFYERHIDRSNNNEVKVRLVHNVTTYLASHRLNIDYIAASGIEVVTGEAVANAVWSKDLSAVATEDSAGWSLRAALGRMGDNVLLVPLTYDAQHQLLTSEVRVYASAVDAEAARLGGSPTPLAVWLTTATWGAAPGEMTQLAQVRQ